VRAVAAPSRDEVEDEQREDAGDDRELEQEHQPVQRRVEVLVEDDAQRF